MNLGQSTIRRDRAAIILAGGEGTRLSEVTRGMTGRHVPKQFCALLGDATLLERTRWRVSLSVASELTWVALNEQHESLFSPLLTGVHPHNLVVQPGNRGTAPAILYSLLRIAETAPNASVLLMPSDHYVGAEAAFMEQVDLAFEAAEERPEFTILLGIAPDQPETAYGWIEPGTTLGAPYRKILQVRRFWEKPSREIARELMARGCLWNSFVIVGRLTTLLGLFLMTQPQLHLSFSGIRPVLGTTFEQETVRRVYDHLHPADFSRHVLQSTAVNLGVLPVANVGWNDLGDPVRLNQVRARLGGTDSALNSSGSHLKEARNNG